MIETQQQEAPQEIPLPPAPALPFTMKSNFAEYRRRLGVIRIVIAIGLSLLLWARFGFIAWLISTVIIALTILLTLGLLHRRKLVVSDEGLTLTTAFGAHNELHWTGFGKVYVFAQYIDQGFGIMPRVIIATKDESGFASFTSLYWNIDDINLLLAALKARNAEVVWYADLAHSSAIAKTLPRLVPYYERHPFVVASGIVVLLMIAITVFVLLTR